MPDCKSDALFLDFDGVICDSVNECFLSSWVAYHDLYLRDLPNSVDLGHYRSFRACRPFIRSGEDYLLIHSLIRDGVTISNQTEFDEAIKRAGSELMAEFRSLIYQVREKSVQDDLLSWLRLHTPFPGLRDPLGAIASNPLVWIVSTKRPDYIVRILDGWGIRWPESRILQSSMQVKRELIRVTMAAHGATSGVFVDDQRDHLRCEGVPELSCRLAEWGYVARDWIDDQSLDPITLEAFVELLRRYDSGSSS